MQNVTNLRKYTNFIVLRLSYKCTGTRVDTATTENFEDLHLIQS